MKKSIEQIRDELAEKYLPDKPTEALEVRYIIAETQGAYKAGFNSGYKLAEERAAEREKKLYKVAKDLLEVVEHSEADRSHPEKTLDDLAEKLEKSFVFIQEYEDQLRGGG